MVCYVKVVKEVFGSSQIKFFGRLSQNTALLYTEKKHFLHVELKSLHAKK
jgi:hypothetical protein